MKKLINPKLTATHHFPEVNIFTEEFISADSESAAVIVSSSNGTIIVKSEIQNGAIVTSVVCVNK